MRILFADDHDLMRQTLVAGLKADPGFDVLEARSVHEVVDMLLSGEDRRLDLILLDINMPGMNTLEGLKRVMRFASGTPVALISGSTNAAEIEHGIEIGAAGFIPKTMRLPAVVSAITLMASGERYVPVDWIATEKKCLSSKLNPRELRVLYKLGSGKTNSEIARSTSLSEPTVKHHLRMVFRKLGVENRTEASLIGRDLLRKQ